MPCYVPGCKARSVYAVTHPRFGHVPSCAAHDPNPDSARKTDPKDRPAPVDAPWRCYLYCIIRGARPLRAQVAGILDQPVYTVACEDIAAVISDVPPVLEATLDTIQAVPRVQNAVMMSEPAMLPMDWGTVFKNKDDVWSFLHSAYNSFCDVLDQMHGKWEYTLRVLWDRQNVINTLVDQDGAVPPPTIGGGWLARKKAEKRFAAALQGEADALVNQILNRLQDVSLARRIRTPIGDAMILNTAVLVSQGSGEPLEVRVRELSVSHERLTFDCRGPAPPYSFVDVKSASTPSR